MRNLAEASLTFIFTVLKPLSRREGKSSVSDDWCMTRLDTSIIGMYFTPNRTRITAVSDEIYFDLFFCAY